MGHDADGTLALSSGAPHPQSAVFDWFQQPILEARPEDAYMAEYPYFRCVPMMAGSVVPGAQPVTWYARAAGHWTGGCTTADDFPGSSWVEARRRCGLW